MTAARLRLPLALAAAAFAAAFAAGPAQAGHLLRVTDLTIAKGKDFASTTDKYWAHSKVYRRGDRFEATVKFVVVPGWELRKATLVLELDGPPGLSHVYDVATCQLNYVAPLPPPPPATGSCTSPQGTVSFRRFEGLSPVLEISLKRPAATDVRVGGYRLLAVVTQAELFNLIPTTDCVSDPCRAELKPLYVIFNPYPSSGDGHVTGLSAPQLASFAAGDEDRYYPGGTKNVTLRPADKEVFGTAIAFVDPLGTASAKGAADGLTDSVAGYVTGEWPVKPGSVFKTGNVPDFIREKKGGASVCGQCMIFASLTTAFDRSLGVPSRMLTAKPSYAKAAGGYWNFHVWSELWLNQVTSGAWSAHDASRGRVTGWGLDITPVKPAKRQDAVFKERFTATGSSRPRAYATKENGAREEVTTAYNPRPHATPVPSANIVVYPAKPLVRYGEPIHFAATFANPTARRVTVSTQAAVTLEFLEGNYLRADNVAFSARGRVSIPAHGRVLRMFAVRPSAYSLSGTFAVRAAMTLGRRTHRNSALVRVGNGLRLRLAGPPSITPGRPVDVRIAVENELAKPLKNVRVAVHVPDYMQPSATSFSADLPPRGQRILDLTLTPPDGVNEVIEVQAVSAEAGVALSSLRLGAGGLPSSDPPGPAMRLPRTLARVTSRKLVPIVLRCPARVELGCSGRVTLKRRTLELGSSPFSLKPGRMALVQVPLSKRAAALVRRQRRLRARAVVVALDGLGNARTTTRPLTLLAA